MGSGVFKSHGNERRKQLPGRSSVLYQLAYVCQDLSFSHGPVQHMSRKMGTYINIQVNKWMDE